MSFKPNGYNSLSPYLIIDGAQRLMNLLKEIFNAKEMRSYDLPDGKIMHAEVQIDDSILMLSDASEKYPAIINYLHVYLTDVDAAYARAIAAGCTEVDPPKSQDGDPDRRGSFMDFGGNIWSVSTQQG